MNNIGSNNILKEIQNDFINIKAELKNIQIDLQKNSKSPKSNYLKAILIKLIL